MFGKNPKRPPETGDGQRLKVVEIFPTLQGEGPYVGQPAAFLRLGGCNLACEFCDTEFEAFEELALPVIIERVIEFANATPSPDAPKSAPTSPKGEVSPAAAAGAPLPWERPEFSLEKIQGEGAHPRYLRDLVVITGGEPLRQNIAPLCEALLAKGLRVQIETNGTLFIPLPEGVDIVCSPKVTDGRYHLIRPDLLARVNAFKFIISADDADYAEVGEVGQAGTAIPVYVQPMDSYDPAQNAANLARAVMLAQTRGYRLSIQIHKLLDIP